MATRVRPRGMGTRAEDNYFSGYANAEAHIENGRTNRTSRRTERVTRRAEPEVRVIGSVDYALLIVVIILVLFGIVMVFSSSHMISTRIHGTPFHFLRLNLFFAGVGFILMLFFANFRYELFRPLALLSYAVALGLLVLVIFFGEEINGARRWIRIGGPNGFQFQPSELARASLIFTMAFLIEKFPNVTRTFKGLFMLVMVVGLMVGLIVLPGGLSVGVITTTVGLGMIAVASPHFWKLGILGGAGAAGFAGYLFWEMRMGDGFRGRRFSAWLDPFADRLDTGFQTVQSLLAIASGQWFGLGAGQSRQVSFIPEPMNDIIFAIIVEEFGFIGAAMVIMLFGIFIWRGIIVSMRAPDTFSSMIALGIVFAIGFQAIINIAVVTNTIPNTGVNLPFISYGGTSLVVTMALAGVLLNISRYSTQRKG